MNGKVLLAAVSSLSMVALSACGSGSAGNGDAGEDGRSEVVLNVVSSHERTDSVNDGFWMFVDKLEKSAPWVKIEYKGAGEVMEPTQLMEATATGAIDMTQTAFAYYPQNIPLVDAMKLTPFLPEEERSNGVYDILQAAHEKQNVHFLGRTGANAPFKLYLNDGIDSADLSGMQIRTSPVYVAMLEAMGAAPVSIPPSDIYTSMERGVVDGFGWPTLGVTHNGWDEVTKYELDVPFYDIDFAALINLDVWNGLDQETQEAMTNAMSETEVELVKHYAELVEKEFDERRAAGVELIKFPEAEATRFEKIAYEAGWKAVLDKAPESQKLLDIFKDAYEHDYDVG